MLAQLYDLGGVLRLDPVCNYFMFLGSGRVWHGDAIPIEVY